MQAEESVPALSSVQAIVSVADQKIVVLRDGGVIAKYPISTSRFGVGDQSGSYKTPLGKLRVYEKLGDNLPPGAVIKHRRATGEVLSVNAPGRDPIVTRILWLDGTEPQNERAKSRAIYIHGTPEEKLIGKPVSYGCIRMRSKDVIALYEDLSVGAPISIIPEKLPRLAKYVPPAPTRVAKVPPTKEEKEEGKLEAATLAETAKARETEPTKAPIPASTARTALALAKTAVEERRAEAPIPETRSAEAKNAEAKVARHTAAASETKTAETKTAELLAKGDKITAPRLAVSAPAKKTTEAKAEPIASTQTVSERVARPERVAAAKPNAKPLVAVASVSDDGRSATVRKRPLVSQPIAAPVDPARLAFIQNHEANLAAARATPDMMSRTQSSSTPGPTVDLSSRMKGSILDTGLTH